MLMIHYFSLNSYDKAMNFKWILSCFERLSGIKINFHKTDILTFNLSDEVANSFAQFFCCKIGSFPLKYGLHLHFHKLYREDLQPISDRIINNISG